MCFVSVVSDQYNDYFKRYTQQAAQTPTWVVPQAPVDVAELRKLVEEFKEAVTMAQKLDVLTRQPDCVDPEKAVLQERVAELEKRLSDIAATAQG